MKTFTLTSLKVCLQYKPMLTGNHDRFSSRTTLLTVRLCRFEQDYARPALKTSQAFFDDHPIAAVRP
jgi:hypothetical protein